MDLKQQLQLAETRKNVALKNKGDASTKMKQDLKLLSNVSFLEQKIIRPVETNLTEAHVGLFALLQDEAKSKLMKEAAENNYPGHVIFERLQQQGKIAYSLTFL